MSYMIKDLPKEERPRERLLKYGVESLSNRELLAIVLKTGTKDYSVIDIATNILNDIKDIKNLRDIKLNKLLEFKGVGEAKAIEILSVIDLGRRIFLEKEESNKKMFNHPKKIYDSSRHLFFGKKQEYFYCFYFNSKQELIERKLLFMGTINKSIVHPREVFKEAYLLSATSIICMHNHPSGDVNPSIDDINLTKTLCKIGKIQNIPVVDHIIVGDNEYYSFYEHNILDL